MKEEFILEDKELRKYLDELKGCFAKHLYKAKPKHLQLIYDYIRFYKFGYLGDAQGSFNYIFHDKVLLSNLGLVDYSNMENEYTYAGKHLYLTIKLLEIESSVLKYRLSYMQVGILY